MERDHDEIVGLRPVLYSCFGTRRHVHLLFPRSDSACACTWRTAAQEETLLQSQGQRQEQTSRGLIPRVTCVFSYYFCRGLCVFALLTRSGSDLFGFFFISLYTIQKIPREVWSQVAPDKTTPNSKLHMYVAVLCPQVHVLTAATNASVCSTSVCCVRVFRA